jgi:hypothetical protein
MARSKHHFMITYQYYDTPLAVLKHHEPANI